MTVRELILKLRVMDPDAIVILSKDGEGNDFSPLPIDGIEEGYADIFNGYRAEFYYPIDFDDSKDVDLSELKKCIALFPTN